MIEQIKNELAKTLNYLLGRENFAETPKVYQPDEINISERVIGGKVELVNSDGTLSPIEDGDYELSDGFKFSVKDGLISAIEGEESIQASEDMADAPVVEEPNNDSDIKASIEELRVLTEELKSEVDTMKAALDELKAANADTANKDAIENFRKELSTLNETIISIANTPAEFSKTTKSQIAKDVNDKKLSDLSNIISQINNKK